MSIKRVTFVSFFVIFRLVKLSCPLKLLNTAIFSSMEFRYQSLDGGERAA